MPIREGINISDEDAVAYDKLKQTATYYDKLQYVYKIKLNSFYGALTNKYFRFFDLRMGESTTGTGRAILMHQCAECCKVLDGEYALPDRHEQDKEGRYHVGYTDKYSVVYGDTDSSYFVTHAENDDEAILIADQVGKLVNDSFPKFMRETFRCQPEYDQIIQTGREIVSNRGIFVDKKRYILHIINDDGYPVDKIKVMGLDTKKTTMPKEISKVLNNFVARFLKREDWNDIAKDIVDYKDSLYNTKDIMSIGLPKGIKGIEAYYNEYLSDQQTRLPGHVAAGMLYNMCLKQYNDTESPHIATGMKIKIFYLRSPITRFKAIAIPVDIDQLPSWFVTGFVEGDLIDKESQILRLVDKPLNNIIKAVGLSTPTRQTLFNNNLMVF